MAKKITNEKKPSKSEIANLAYQLFEQEGRPHGRELEHWLQAESVLLNETEEVSQKRRERLEKNQNVLQSQ